MRIESSNSSKVVDRDDAKLKKQLKALIVDDDPVCRMIMCALLNSLGVEKQEAVNGKEAVELHQAGANFNVILMDREMPIMDGPKATRILRSMGVRSKIVGVSTVTGHMEIREFMNAGIDECHVKPMTRAKLVSILEEFYHYELDN